MKKNHLNLREILSERRPTFGTWIQIGHPAVAEILADIGFDWIAADMEHSDIDNAAFTGLARAMYGRGVTPLVRSRENDTLAIRQVLDLGAQGVIVPLVNTPEDAERAVQAAKFPPLGIRGYCFSRMNRWGRDFEKYAMTANDNIIVMVMIESQEGVENSDEILAVNGVDGAFIGPYDLSGSYRVPGQVGHELVQKGCQRVLEACFNTGKTAGQHLVNPEKAAIRKAVENGFTFLALGVDTVFLQNAACEILKIVRDLNPR